MHVDCSNNPEQMERLDVPISLGCAITKDYCTLVLEAGTTAIAGMGCADGLSGRTIGPAVRSI